MALVSELPHNGPDSQKYVTLSREMFKCIPLSLSKTYLTDGMYHPTYRWPRNC